MEQHIPSVTQVEWPRQVDSHGKQTASLMGRSLGQNDKNLLITIPLSAYKEDKEHRLP